MTTSHSELGIIPAAGHKAETLPDSFQMRDRPYSKAPGDSSFFADPQILSENRCLSH